MSRKSEVARRRTEHEDDEGFVTQEEWQAQQDKAKAAPKGDAKAKADK